MSTRIETEHRASHVLVARLIGRAMECSREIQEIVLEMAAIVVDENSAPDEIDLAYEAMIEALDPGMTADCLDNYKAMLGSSEFVEHAAQLKAEQEAFADRLRSAMEKKSFTELQLAEKTGIGQPAISNLLHSKYRPQFATVKKLADALEVSPDALWPGFSVTKGS